MLLHSSKFTAGFMYNVSAKHFHASGWKIGIEFYRFKSIHSCFSNKAMLSEAFLIRLSRFPFG